MIKSIFILESSWDNNASLEHYSLLPIISEFAKLRGFNTYHKVFTDTNSLRHWIGKYNKECSKGSLLYIAAHGTKRTISGLNTSINRGTIINTIAKAKNIQFVHFGSCLFGNEENLRALLKKAKNLSWVAGYDQSIDWVDSSLFDILLWSRITPHGRGIEDKSVKTHTIVKKLLDNEAKSLIKDLGFNFVYRYGETVTTVSSN